MKGLKTEIIFEKITLKNYLQGLERLEQVREDFIKN